MSAAPSTAKPASASGNKGADAPPKDLKSAAALEEDDEFEDFPVESRCPGLFLVGEGRRDVVRRGGRRRGEVVDG